MLTCQGRLLWVGSRQDLPSVPIDQTVDLDQAWVTPGLIDCHTHAVFGGNRSQEFERRLQGETYAQIAASGGGILHSVRCTRQASEDDLLSAAVRRVTHLMQDGVTTIEVKSGYGLDLPSEQKMLRVARRLGKVLPITVRTTCLAAHALPPEYAGRADAYIDHVCQAMLPALASEGLIDAVDAFCETIAFSTAQVERVFRCASDHGLPVKLHAEQLSNLGGSRLAASFSALSVDHLEYLADDDLPSLATAGTVAVLLPGAFHVLRETKLPPVDGLREHGIPMAVATDLNPGTSPALSLRLMINLACIQFGLTPEEGLAGVTCHAARALGIHATHGTLEAGKTADFIAWQIEHPAELAYWLGGILPHRRIVAGQLTPSIPILC
jgi:imidazolonepropionase